MANSEHHFADIQKIVKWFTKDEVKTPLSFFFKVIPFMTAAWVAVLYAPGLDGAWVFIGLCGLVAVFAFLRPKHLVYGESGHRAERKLEFGTEKHTYTLQEVEQLPPSRNSNQIENRKVDLL